MGVLGSFDLQVDTTAKRAAIRDAFVVQLYKQRRTVGWQVPPIGRLTPQQKGQELGMLL